MTENPFWLALGAFLTSPGFGGAAAILAAFGAYRGISARAGVDRALTSEQDERERWWQIADWLWSNRASIGTEQALSTLENLRSMADTRGQLVMLETLGLSLTQEEGP